MENKKRGRIIFIFLPLLVMSLIQTGASFFLSQIYVGIVAKTKGPLSIKDMVEELFLVSSGEAYYLTYTLLSGVLCLLVFWLWYRFVLKEEAGNVVELNLVKPSYPTILLGGLLCAAGGQFVLTFAAELLIKIKPDWLIAYQGALESVGLSAQGQSAISLALGLYVVLVAPVMEELLFRGVCLKYTLRCFGPMASMVISSVMFAIMHGNPLQSAVTFIFAMVLGYICIKTDTVWIAIFIHMVFNAASYFMPGVFVLTKNPVADFVILFTSMVAVYLGVGCILRAGAKK